ncbi:MAG: hypothetical protein U0174_15630 [Polyangiaceae bacterium]
MTPPDTLASAAPSGIDPRLRQIEILGIFPQSFARACINLSLLGDVDLAPQLESRPDAWSSGADFAELLQRLGERYRDFDPIKERIGEEMMRLWYEFGGGRSVVSSGIDYLKFQVGSQGYRSVVRGPEAAIGSFDLVNLDVDQGRATVRSSTPFDKVMERGILVGGMRLAGDLVFVDVDDSREPGTYHLSFR